MNFTADYGVHGTSFTDMTNNLPCVYICNTHQIIIGKIGIQTESIHFTGKLLREFLANESGNLDAFTFYFFLPNTIIANMIIGHYQYLPGIGRICKYFLISGHTSIKTDFAGCCADFSNGGSFKDTAILQH